MKVLASDFDLTLYVEDKEIVPIFDTCERK